MLLSEVGYEQERHDQGIELIRSNNLGSISEVIEELVSLYAKLYKVDAYSINCGMCEDFANDVVSLVPGAVAEWGDGFCTSVDDPEIYAYHCIVFYQNKFYDSEHPDGEDDFRLISAFN